MPRGGARVNSGPPPDPNALRRSKKHDQATWTDLPAEGRQGPVPEWPLAASEVDRSAPPAVRRAAVEARRRAADREVELWRELWATPQAVVWERMGWRVEVALYVRLVVQAERAAETKALAEARMWSDRLGLNPAAMLRNRWRVVADEVAARRSVGGTPSSSVRDRLRAVNGGT